MKTTYGIKAHPTKVPAAPDWRIRPTGRETALVWAGALALVLSYWPRAAQADFNDDIVHQATPAHHPTQPKASPSAATPSQQGQGKGEPGSAAPKPAAQGSAAEQKVRQSAGTNDSATTKEPAAPKGLLADDLTKHDTSAPIDFRGNVMKGQRAAGQVDLQGDVVITQADARITANSATLLSDRASQQTRKAIARGNVRLTKQPTSAAPPLRAEAEEMEFFVPERRVVMTGKPKVWRGNELIQGREILLDLNSGEVTIKEARGTVEPGKAPRQAQ